MAVNLLLGKTGSGRSRYMYSIVAKNLYEGKDCLIFSDSFSLRTLTEAYEFKYGSFNRIELGKISILSIHNLNSKEIVDLVKNTENFDYFYLEPFLNDVEFDVLLNELFILGVECTVIKQIRPDFNYDDIKDHSLLQDYALMFGSILYFNKGIENLSVIELYVDLDILYEKRSLYHLDSLKYCDFD